MTYTPPAGNAVDFNASGSYTPPAGNAVDFNLTNPTPATNVSVFVITG